MSQFVNPYLYNDIWFSAAHVKNHDGFQKERVYITTFVLVLHLYFQKYRNQTVSKKVN